MSTRPTVTASLAAAAIAGLLAGATSVQASAAPKAGISTAQRSSRMLGKTASTAATSTAPAAKHDCKGKNDCKGTGGCSSGDNGCKGKNSCKGKGGCNTNK